MKAETIEILERERERESYVLENRTGLVFVPKFIIYYVKYRTFLKNKERSFYVLFSQNFTSGYI